MLCGCFYSDVVCVDKGLILSWLRMDGMIMYGFPFIKVYDFSFTHILLLCKDLTMLSLIPYTKVYDFSYTWPCLNVYSLWC